MDCAELIVDPARFFRGEQRFDGPIALVDLGRIDPAMELALPACPLLGLGDPDHPSAALVDAVIEPPIGAARVIERVLSQPHSASVAVALLRLLPGLDPELGLTAESFAYGLLQGSDEHKAWLAATAERRPPSGTPGRVQVTRQAGRLTLVLDNGARGNAIDRAMRDALYEAFALAALDPDVERVELRANGRTFSLGAELGEFGTTRDPAAAHAIRAKTLPAWMIARCADTFEAHIHGACIGAGLEMAAWARRITATANTWFQLPELAMGLIPGAGGCVSLTRRIGRSRTALMILSGRRLSARAALHWGLIDEIVDQPS